jgi:tetratricopeptide (TPR) repeat protein
VELIVLACKSNALRCRLLGTTREVTLRTAVRDEIPGSIITVTPKKHWTHARHPYLSGEVSVVRIDATVLGLVPLALRYEGEWESESVLGGRPHGRRPMFQMEKVIAGAVDDFDSNPIIDAKDRDASGDYAGGQEILTNVLALDHRCLEVHAHLGDHEFRHRPSLALRHYELGVAIGSLTVGADFDGVLPWGLLDNRPFLRCLQGMGRALFRLGQGDAAAEAFRRLLRLDPADHFCARADLAAIESGKTWRDLEGADP